MLTNSTFTAGHLHSGTPRCDQDAISASPYVSASSRPRWCAASRSQLGTGEHGTAQSSFRASRPNPTTPADFAL
jgi:hypothetical protein